MEEEEGARQKLQLEKVQCDAKLKKLEEDLALRYFFSFILWHFKKKLYFVISNLSFSVMQ